MILNENISVKDLLETLEINHERIAFLINEDKVLTGSISQGDIIRALINGVSLKISSIEIANLNVKKIKNNENAKSMAIELIISEGLHAVPIINNNGEIVSIIDDTKILKELNK